jgi:hypothetical protein
VHGTYRRSFTDKKPASAADAESLPCIETFPFSWKDFHFSISSFLASFVSPQIFLDT